MSQPALPVVLQSELEGLRHEMDALMERWAATDPYDQRQLRVLNCRRELLLARIRTREQALAEAGYPQGYPQSGDSGQLAG